MLGVFCITVLELSMWIKTVFLEMKGTQVWHLFPKAEVKYCFMFRLLHLGVSGFLV